MDTLHPNIPQTGHDTGLIRRVSVWVPFLVAVAVPLPAALLLIVLGWVLAIDIEGRRDGIPIAALLTVVAVLGTFVMQVAVVESQISFG